MTKLWICFSYLDVPKQFKIENPLVNHALRRYSENLRKVD